MLAPHNQRPYEALPRAQRAGLGAIASVVIMHLEREIELRPDDATAPLLIQVDGPAGPDLVDMVTDGLRAPEAASRWTVMRFDAWQHQRVAPPWWWLITAVDRQLREDFRARGASLARSKRARDYRWRLGGFARDLLPVFPALLIVLLLWYLSGRLPMDEFLKWAVGIIGGLTTVGAFLWSASNLLRRLLIGSPANAAATMRTSDPMADFQRRYSFLIRSADGPVALVIDHLDRCRADYVVELLEGIQTLLKSPASAMDPTPLVAVLVPGDRRWLCDSYLHVYEEFQETTREPGRPFGLAFVDKVFDVALRLPLISPGSTPAAEEETALDDVCRQIAEANLELEIRSLVASTEREMTHVSQTNHPVHKLRVAAVERLGQLEVSPGSAERLCFDTAGHLASLHETVAASPAVLKQLRTAYCVQRTSQLLGGHPIDDDEQAIRRLGLWTILELRWPLLAQHLAEYPDDVEQLKQRHDPRNVDPELAPLFSSPEAASLVGAWPGADLSPATVRRFTSQPLPAGFLPEQSPVPELEAPQPT